MFFPVCCEFSSPAHLLLSLTVFCVVPEGQLQKAIPTSHHLHAAALGGGRLWWP